jgi:hypothetical protein
MCIEEWVQVDGTKDVYISTLGRVKRVHYYKPYKRSPHTTNGVEYVKIKGQVISVPKLMQLTFNPDYDPDIHRTLPKNGMHRDASLDNLKMVTVKEYHQNHVKTHRAKGVLRVSQDNQDIECYISLRDAESFNPGWPRETIRSRCNSNEIPNDEQYEWYWKGDY